MAAQNVPNGTAHLSRYSHQCNGNTVCVCTGTCAKSNRKNGLHNASCLWTPLVMSRGSKDSTLSRRYLSYHRCASSRDCRLYSKFYGYLAIENRDPYMVNDRIYHVLRSECSNLAQYVQASLNRRSRPWFQTGKLL